MMPQNPAGANPNLSAAEFSDVLAPPDLAEEGATTPGTEGMDITPDASGFWA
jgi:hypothetical protein